MCRNNNLRLNTGKSNEMIISRGHKYDIQPSHQVEIERVNSMKILGITLNSELKVDEHIESLIKSSLTSLYTLGILKAHGLRKEAIHKVTEAIIMSRILYAALTWWGLTQASDILKIDKLQRNLQRIEYASHDQPTRESKVHKAEEKLVKKVTVEEDHVLRQYLHVPHKSLRKE